MSNRTRFLGLSFVGLLAAAGLVGAVGLVGCGSDPAPVDATDTGTTADASDTGKIDTGKVDTGTSEVDPTSCAEPLPTGFTCPTPATGTSGTACTEAALQDFVTNCITAKLDVPSTCAAWKTANPTCLPCIESFSWDYIPGKLYPDDYKCYWRSMDAACAKSANCSYDCQDKVCGTCDDTTSERDDCVAAAIKSGGKCYDVAAKDAAVCFEKYSAQIDTCTLDEIYKETPDVTLLRKEILEFYRGACRDNGVWTNKGSATPLDGGTDGGSTDGGSTDGGASDAASDAPADGG
ncbi:MAG: hypothetical protein JNL79_09750 [Myxococcales bacterium]|nr:hypothetical protein [Myxococcales bacterium]